MITINEVHIELENSAEPSYRQPVQVAIGHPGHVPEPVDRKIHDIDEKPWLNRFPDDHLSQGGWRMKVNDNLIPSSMYSVS